MPPLVSPAIVFPAADSCCCCGAAAPHCWPPDPAAELPDGNADVAGEDEGGDSETMASFTGPYNPSRIPALCPGCALLRGEEGEFESGGQKEEPLLYRMIEISPAAYRRRPDASEGRHCCCTVQAALMHEAVAASGHWGVCRGGPLACAAQQRKGTGQVCEAAVHGSPCAPLPSPSTPLPSKSTSRGPWCLHRRWTGASAHLHTLCRVPRWVPSLCRTPPRHPLTR